MQHQLSDSITNDKHEFNKINFKLSGLDEYYTDDDIQEQTVQEHKVQEQEKQKVDKIYNSVLDTCVTIQDIVNILDEENTINKQKKIKELISFITQRWIQLTSIINVLKPDDPLLYDYANDFAHIYNIIQSIDLLQ
jgi:hypothetical protein